METQDKLLSAGGDFIIPVYLFFLFSLVLVSFCFLRRSKRGTLVICSQGPFQGQGEIFSSLPLVILWRGRAGFDLSGEIRRRVGYKVGMVNGQGGRGAPERVKGRKRLWPLWGVKGKRGR